MSVCIYTIYVFLTIINIEKEYYRLMFIKKLTVGLIVASVLISAPLSVKADPIAATSTESNPLASVLNSPLAVQSVTNPLADAAAIQAAQLQAAEAAQAAAIKAAQEQAAQIQALQAAQIKAAQDAQAAAIKAAQDQAAQVQAAQAAAIKAAQDQQAAAIKAAQMAAAAPISSANAAELAKTYPDFVYVSIGEQMAYLYRNGILITSGPCVTGNASRHYDTTVGFHKIVFMDTNRTLHGSYGEAFVKYWMRFTNGGQGLHDAGWRKSFGGDIYKTNGSHGCVNLQRDVAATIFQYAYVGLPVIVMP